MSEKLEHPSTWLLMLSLWLLSTWFGTLILCGAACLSTKFPFFHSYPQLSPEKREKILQGWSQSYFGLLRMLFRTIKLLTLFVFFTQVNYTNSLILLLYFLVECIECFQVLSLSFPFMIINKCCHCCVLCY